MNPRGDPKAGNSPVPDGTQRRRQQGGRGRDDKAAPAARSASRRLSGVGLAPRREGPPRGAVDALRGGRCWTERRASCRRGPRGVRRGGGGQPARRLPFFSLRTGVSPMRTATGGRGGRLAGRRGRGGRDGWLATGVIFRNFIVFCQGMLPILAPLVSVPRRRRGPRAACFRSARRRAKLRRSAVRPVSARNARLFAVSRARPRGRWNNFEVPSHESSNPI